MLVLEIKLRPSPNHKNRPSKRIDCIVIHDTESKDVESALTWFENKESQVSSHYVIDKNGDIYCCVPEELEAWHAGKSELWGESEINTFSIGIELVGDAKDPFPDAQLGKLIELTVEIAERYVIPLNRIVGHCHVAPGRKTDPGIDFPWFEFLNCVGTHLSNKGLESGNG